jgi:hypothetical protein
MRRLVAEVADSGASEQELREAASSMRSAANEPAYVQHWLDSCAANELYGADVTSRQELIAEREAVTPAEVASALRVALSGTVFIGPSSAEVDDGLHRYPRFSTTRAAGWGFQPTSSVPELRGARLVVSETAVSVVDRDGNATTVEFERCQGMLWWRAGRRVLWGDDGIPLDISPFAWQDGHAIIERIDARVPPNRMIPVETPRRGLTRPPLARSRWRQPSLT